MDPTTRTNRADQRRQRDQRPSGVVLGIELTIVLPIFNERATLAATIERLHANLADLGLVYEILCIDDGSTDGTKPLLDLLASDDASLVPIHFTRNFGKEAALQAGVDRARGEAALFLDADLQHPPELIPQMVELWREDGFEIVEARKRRRGRESGLYSLLARNFGRLLGGATGSDMLGATDFKLLGRTALDVLVAMPERHRFFRGLVQWIGFESATIEFDVAERGAGETSWTPLGLLRYGVDALLSFTTAPLLWIALLGVVTTGLGSILGAVALFDYATGNAVDGFTTVILLTVIFSGLILTSLGTLSLYVARLFEEAKQRPLYVVRPVDKRAPGEEPPSRERLERRMNSHE